MSMSGEVTVTRLAVSLVDTERIEPLTRQILLGGKLDPDGPVLVAVGKGREVAVPFICDLLTAACVCQAMRNLDVNTKQPTPTRIYREVEGQWQRVPGDRRLVSIHSNRCHLNPQVFPPKPVPVEEMVFTPAPLDMDGEDD